MAKHRLSMAVGFTSWPICGPLRRARPAANRTRPGPQTGSWTARCEVPSAGNATTEPSWLIVALLDPLGKQTEARMPLGSAFAPLAIGQATAVRIPCQDHGMQPATHRQARLLQTRGSAVPRPKPMDHRPDDPSPRKYGSSEPSKWNRARVPVSGSNGWRGGSKSPE